MEKVFARMVLVKLLTLMSMLHVKILETVQQGNIAVCDKEDAKHPTK